jgi:hypothetical protein
VERDKEEDGFVFRGRQNLFLVRVGLDETKEGDIVRGTCLTVATGLLFRISCDSPICTTNCPRALNN